MMQISAVGPDEGLSSHRLWKDSIGRALDEGIERTLIYSVEARVSVYCSSNGRKVPPG